MSEYYDYGPRNSPDLMIDPENEIALCFALYHLIFDTEKQLQTYEGHSLEDWQRYKRTTSPELVAKLHNLLDWAYDRPDYDFCDLIRPAAGPIANERLYSYICKFRSSIEKYRV